MSIANVRWPAEWERHRGTFLSWPHNRGTWPADVDALEHAFVSAIAALAGSELVFVNVPDAEVSAHVRALLARADVPLVDDLSGAHRGVRLLRIRTNDAWCRDYGPIFVRDNDRGGALVGLDFRFNAWGGKYPPWHRDDSAAKKMCGAVGVPVRSRTLVLEGGALEGNGEGIVLTTESCLLNPNRNGAIERATIEDELAATLGADDVVWLAGGVEGDDTDGHIDNLARFVSRDTVVVLVEPDPRDPNHAPLADNLARLRAYRTRDGRALRVLTLPEPDPLEYDGARLPASYANFYIANDVVLLPVFGGGRDGEAIRIVEDALPGRRVVPIDSRVVVRGFGAWHCLTQQVPA